MTLAARITYIAALFIGLSVELLFGYRSSTDFLKTSGDMRFTTAPWALRDFSQEQYGHADFEHARLALLSYADLLEEIEKAKPDKTHENELSITYTRLALLEDDARNLQQSQEFMTKARSWYVPSGGRNLSDSEMKAALMKFDDRFGLSRTRVGAR
jgi:hypothetical protein